MVNEELFLQDREGILIFTMNYINFLLKFHLGIDVDLESLVLNE